MPNERDGRDAARTELRNRLTDGIARTRLTKTQLAQRTGLSRTTIHQALQVDGPTPSPETVAAVSRELNLPEKEMLELRRAAAEVGHVAPVTTLGKPISEWNPYDLEVHPAGHLPSERGPADVAARALPGYVSRDHDEVLAEAVRDVLEGHSRMVVLVGSSSTGKTRACWEAVQPLASLDWRLWHPFDPTRAEAALADLVQVQPLTVVWLNEAQHYLGDRQVGERVAAAVHNLLTHGPGPILVLGTLWPEYANQYTILPEADAPDPHSRVRELLAGRTVTIPEAFDQAALARAAALARDGDQLLEEALARAHVSGRVTQDLAGAPELLRRYEHSTPAARAVLEASIDARRLGVGLHLPQAFLTDAAADYLSDDEFDELAQDWAEAAFAELARPVHGKQACLRRTGTRPQRRPPGRQAPGQMNTPAGGPVFRLADYLEQHGRATRQGMCPPASFWYAAHAHLTQAEDLYNLARAADARHRLQWGHHLWQRAADLGSIPALIHVAQVQEQAGDLEGAEGMARRAADAGHADALTDLIWRREQAGDQAIAKEMLRRASEAGLTDVLVGLALHREQGGYRERASALYQQAAYSGNPEALANLARIREQAGDHDEAEALAQKAADVGCPYILLDLARIREQSGHPEHAEALYRQAANAGSTRALVDLACLREKAGDHEGADEIVRRAVEAGHTRAMADVARIREEAGDLERAEEMAHRAIKAGNTDVLIDLARMQEHYGNLHRAEILHRQAVSAGAARALSHLARLREAAGDLEHAEALYRQADRAGYTRVLVDLARVRERAGDREEAEAIAWRAAKAGQLYALTHLALFRDRAGDHEGAETLAHKARNAGYGDVLLDLAQASEKARNLDRAEALYRQAADAGNPEAWKKAMWMRERAGDHQAAEMLALEAADAGLTYLLLNLAQIREVAGDRAEALYQQAADAGHTTPLHGLAEYRKGLGDLERAAALLREAAEADDTRLDVETLHGLAVDGQADAWVALAQVRKQTGDPEEVEAVYREAADAGYAEALPAHQWPHGLDPDGTPTPPWE